MASNCAGPNRPKEQQAQPEQSENRRDFLAGLMLSTAAGIMGHTAARVVRTSSGEYDDSPAPQPLKSPIPEIREATPSAIDRQESSVALAVEVVPATTASANAIELIKGFEKCELRAYRCPAGVPTIGYGHTRGVKMGDTLAGVRAAEHLLKQDIEEHCRQVRSVFKDVPLTQGQFDALVSASYNSWCLKGGKSGFAKHAQTELAKLNASEDPAERLASLQSVVSYLSSYNRSNGKMLDGLLRRRLSEGLLMAGDSNPLVSLTEYFALKERSCINLNNSHPTPSQLAPEMVRCLFKRRGVE